jgi:FlgD Ig-like domain
MKIKIILSLLINLTILSISFSQVPASQDTIYISGGTLIQKNNAGLMEKTINQDITQNGLRINPNRVYALYEGQIYYQLAPINVNNPTGTLTIAGIPDPKNPTATEKPIILILPTNGNPVVINGGGVNLVYGSLKFDNIYYVAQQIGGTTENVLFYCGTANKLPQSLTINNCLFEFSNLDLFDCTNDSYAIGWPYGAKFRITNSYFRNLFHNDQWWGSTVFMCKHPIDTCWVENCTVTGGGLIFLQQRELADFTYINHNTFVNTHKYWMLCPYKHNEYITNNIFINQNWVGEDKNVLNSGQDPDNLPLGTIDIDTNNTNNKLVVQTKYYSNLVDSTISSALSLDSMHIYISNNVNYNDPLIASGYYNNSSFVNASLGTPPSYLTWYYRDTPFKIENQPGIWMNSRTKALFTKYGPPSGGFVEENTVTTNPNTQTPAIADASVVTLMGQWNQFQWGDPAYSNMPDIVNSKYIFGDYSSSTLPGFINGSKSDNITTNAVGVQVGITKFTDLTENFSQSTIISTIDNLPVGALIWNDALLANYNSADDFNKVSSAYSAACNKSTTRKVGDVDGTGGPDAYSASLVLQYLVGLKTLNSLQLNAADADKDLKVTANDAEWILYATVYGTYPNGSLPKTTQSQPGRIIIGQVNLQENSNSVTIPIVLYQSQGIHACYIELNIDRRYADIENVTGNLPKGWLMAQNYTNGVLKIAMAGVDPLTDGKIAAINLNLKDKNAKLDINGTAKLNANYDQTISGSAVKAVISQFGLSQNYPNPFNPSTVINYQIAQNSQVNLTVYDILGQKVKTLVNGLQQAGYYNITWDGSNDLGSKVAAGIYFYRLQSGNFFKTLKMNLLK